MNPTTLARKIWKLLRTHNQRGIAKSTLIVILKQMIKELETREY